MVRMFKRSNGKLYVEYEACGKTIQKSTRLEDTKQNRAFIQKEVIPALQKKILRGDFEKNKPDTFKAYSERYLKEKSHLKTSNRVEKHIEVINGFFGDFRIDQLKRSDVKEWIGIQLEHNTPKTVRNYLTSVRGVIDVAIDKEVVTHNVARDIKLPSHYTKEVEPFSSNEVKKLLDNANDFFRLFLAIGFYTGLRTGEIMGLMHSDVDLNKKIIYVRRSISDGKLTTPKTEKSIREVPIFDDLVPYLNNGTKKSLWLFHIGNGTHMNHFGGNRVKEWVALLKKCEIPYRKLYSTRHTFIVSMLKNSDMSILEIAQVVGHTTSKMIIQNYGKFIKGEHLKIDRKLNLFQDKTTDIK